VYGVAGSNNVGAEGMQHLGLALQTNRTVTHVTIACELLLSQLCIVRSGGADVWVCEVANKCVWWCS